MRDALQHIVLLVFATAFSAVGWLMAHNPERTYRLFTFGIQPENRILVGFWICGWVFAVVFAAGAVMHLVLLARTLPDSAAHGVAI